MCHSSLALHKGLPRPAPTNEWHRPPSSQYKRILPDPGRMDFLGTAIMFAFAWPTTTRT